MDRTESEPGEARETAGKMGCGEEDNRPVPSLDSEWVFVVRTGFLRVFERRLEKEGANRWNI